MLELYVRKSEEPNSPKFAIFICMCKYASSQHCAFTIFSATLSFFSVIKKSCRQFVRTSTCRYAAFVIHMQTITFCVAFSWPGLTTLTTAAATPILLFRLTAGRPSTLCDVIHSSELQPQRIMERAINSCNGTV